MLLVLVWRRSYGRTSRMGIRGARGGRVGWRGCCISRCAFDEQAFQFSAVRTGCAGLEEFLHLFWFTGLPRQTCVV